MSWDVFISYAKEDHFFAWGLARHLEAVGLRVWFDETVLEAGDSLRRSIDKGLRESQYGVVVLSKNFFKKEWPQRELDGLLAREDGTSKVILPVWLEVSAEDVRSYSPILADKLGIHCAGGSARNVVTKILRAIERDRVGLTGWGPSFTNLVNGTEMVVLPLLMTCDNQPSVAICIGRYPVLNAEYQRFVADTGHRQPIGKTYRDGQWRGPFEPWESELFCDPEKPAVCISFWDATAYVGWLSMLAGNEVHVFVPPAALWDFVAIGSASTLHLGRNMDLSKVYHRESSPAVVDRSSGRANVYGVTDMIGNVWEWVSGIRHKVFGGALIGNTDRSKPELRGGSYHDDLEESLLACTINMLDDGVLTRHSDLGFRIAARVPVSNLPPATAALLESQPGIPSDLRFALSGVDSYLGHFGFGLL